MCNLKWPWEIISLSLTLNTKVLLPGRICWWLWAFPLVQCTKSCTLLQPSREPSASLSFLLNLCGVPRATWRNWLPAFNRKSRIWTHKMNLLRDCKTMDTKLSEPRGKEMRPEQKSWGLQGGAHGVISMGSFLLSRQVDMRKWKYSTVCWTVFILNWFGLRETESVPKSPFPLP